jgi:uncharacterized protein YecT (DUF1311 family)
VIVVVSVNEAVIALRQVERAPSWAPLTGILAVKIMGMPQMTRKTRVLRKVALLGLALFWNTELFAANDEDAATQYSTCVRNSEGVTSKILDCISAELSRQDSRLNDAYKKLMSKLPKNRKKSLVEAQRSWIKFRETNCAFYDDPNGGSAAHTAGNECFLNATVDRAKELEKLLSD